MRCRGLGSIPPAAFVFCLALHGSAARAAAPEAPQKSPRYVEKAGVTLTLLDVEAVDRSGKPLRGLTLKDFTVRLDGKLWPIYSVDDSCACADPETAAAPLSRATDGGRSASAATEPMKYIIYIDFSQLQAAGRLRVRSEAARWIRETMGPADQVMIVANTSSTGLSQLSPFTRDRNALLAAVEKAYSDKAFVDDFPDLLQNRVDECEEYAPICPGYAMDEYLHGRNSLRALKRFLDSLESVSGRKSLLLFHENGSMQPGVFFGSATPGQLAAVEEVAAAANTSRTTLYPVNMGMLPAEIGRKSLSERLEKQALDLAAPLAEFTGGEYNRGPSDRARFVDRVGRGCRCLYRIGLRPPEGESRHIYPVEIEAAGIHLANTYRVQFLNEADRWMREAEAVLRHPGEAKAIDVAAAILPSTAGKTWSVAVEIAVSSDALALLPGAGGREGLYEVGALLHTMDGSRSWEMLGEYKVRRGPEGVTDRVAVQRREIGGLKPGRYRLAAFVRDRSVDLFGGAEAFIDLPAAGGVAGPVMLRASQRHIVAALPLASEEPAGTAPVAATRVGSVPAAGEPVVRGESVEFETWVCPPEGAPMSAMLRFAARDGAPIFRFESTEPAPAGRCLRYTDSLDTSRLPTGRYEYHIRWGSSSGGASDDAVAPFEIGEATGRPGKGGG